MNHNLYSPIAIEKGMLLLSVTVPFHTLILFLNYVRDEVSKYFTVKICEHFEKFYESGEQ